MKRKIVFAVLVAGVVILAISAPALAKRPDNPGGGSEPLEAIWAAIQDLQTEVVNIWAAILGLDGRIGVVEGWGNHSAAGYLTGETDPTVNASVKDGVDWSEIGSIPCDISDGDQVGLTSESDPTVASSVKDGVDWTEVTGRPAGLDDGDDVGIISETDPVFSASEAAGMTSGDISKWNTYWDNTYVVPAAAFAPGSSQGCSNQGCNISCEAGAGQCAFVAPIQLPWGVTLEDLVLYAYNDATSGESLRVSIHQYDRGTQTASEICSNTIGSWSSSTPIYGGVLNKPVNEDCFYWILVELEEGSLGFIEAQIHYVYTDPMP
jgi:hypothetical protein